MPEDAESLRRDCQVERESQGLDFAEKAHWCSIWSQGRGPGRSHDYWQCHQGISERRGTDIRYGRHLQGRQSGNRVQLWRRGEQCRFWIHVLRDRQLQRLSARREKKGFAKRFRLVEAHAKDQKGDPISTKPRLAGV